MRLEGLDLNLVVALEAILRLRSVSAAAQELSLTQSALSRSLSRLREYFGDEIVSQQGRRLLPTPFGVRIGPVAAQLLSEARAFTQMRAEFDPGSAEREFGVICSDYVTQVFLTRVARRLATEAPGIRLRCITIGSGAEERYLRGEIDFLIGPEVALHDGFRSLKLFDDSFVVIADADNPNVANGLDRDLYLSSSHVMTAFGAEALTGHLERSLRGKDISLKAALVVPSFIVVPSAVRGSPFLAAVHARLADDLREHTDLRFFPLPFDVAPLAEFVEWHPTRDHDLAALWMRKVFSEVAEDMGEPSGLTHD